MTVPPDSLRAALDSVFATGAYDWRGADVTMSWIHRQWLALMSWLTQLRAVNPLVYRALIVLLLVVLIAILLHAALTLVRTIRRAGPVTAGAAEAPAAEAHDAGWYRVEADRLLQAGAYRAALQASFAALSRQFDADGLLPFDASRTPAECAREARLTDDDRSRLRRLVGDLYLAVFAGVPVAAGDVVRWRTEADRPWHATAH